MIQQEFKNNILRHKPSGELLKLIKLRESNVNTYIQVDSKGRPIIKKRSWSAREDEQLRLVIGFNSLEVYER